MIEKSREPFFDAFSEALAGNDHALEPWWVDGSQGLAGLTIYRNTVYKGLADAIAASFPSVLKVVGPDWMREAAVIFARSHLPENPILINYGASFPDWLRLFEPAHDMPYLADLARLDRLWTESHLAEDSAPLDAQILTKVAPETLAGLTLHLIASARLVRFQSSIHDLWKALRCPDRSEDLELDDRPQSVLVWRPAGEVKTLSLTPEAYEFLKSCQRAENLASAAASAARFGEAANLTLIFSDLISTDVFSSITPPQSQ